MQIDEQLERMSKRIAPEQFREFLLEVATKYGITSVPSITNEEFVSTVVFDLAKARGTPKARLAYLFPNSHSAQIVIRLKPGLSESERRDAIALIKEAVAETTPRKACAEGGKAAPCFALRGGEYVVTGAPVVVDGIARALKNALLLLFGVAIVVMAIVLLLAFRSRMRLLPLALALASAALVFGLLELVGGSLTMAVDRRPADPDRPRRRLRDPVPGATRRGPGDRRDGRGGSPHGREPLRPDDRHGLPRHRRRLPRPPPLADPDGEGLRPPPGGRRPPGLRPGDDRRVRRPEHAPSAVAPRGDHLEEASATGGMVGPDGDRTRPLRALLDLASNPSWSWPSASSSPRSAGGSAPRSKPSREVRQLAPHSLSEVKDLNTYEAATGTTGDLEVLVEAPDLTDPATIEWMAGFKRRVLAADEVTAGPALSDFLTSGEGKVTKSGIEATLAALSSY